MNARNTKQTKSEQPAEQKTAIAAEVVLSGEPGSEGHVCVLNLSFANGEKLQIDANRLDANIRCQAMLHGLKQKLVDAAAISRDPDTGRAATIQTKYKAVREVFDRLTDAENPSWNKNREGGGSGSGGLLFRALVRMYDGKKSPEDIKAYLEKKSDAEKTALRGNPKVATLIEKIRAEDGKAAKIDTDALLNELG